MRAKGLINVLLLASFPGLTACTTESEEAKIHRFIGRTLELAEKSDVAGLVDRLAPDYSDFQGRDREDARALIGDYLRSRTGVVIHLLATRIEARDPEGRPRVRIELMISSGVAEAFRRLVRLSGEYFRFGLVLDRAGADGWLIRFAEWEHLDAGELLPESLELLKKLFSGK